MPISTAKRGISERTFGDQNLKLTFVIKDNEGRTVERQRVELVLKVLPKVEVKSVDVTNPLIVNFNELEMV